jgi:hypothetical protein
MQERDFTQEEEGEGVIFKRRPKTKRRNERRNERHQTSDDELLAKHVATIRTKQRPPEFRHIAVPASEMKAVMDETVWRVLREINPEISDDRHHRLNSDELSRIIRIHMYVGSDAYEPRASLRIKETPMDEPPLCDEHR